MGRESWSHPGAGPAAGETHCPGALGISSPTSPSQPQEAQGPFVQWPCPAWPALPTPLPKDPFSVRVLTEGGWSSESWGPWLGPSPDSPTPFPGEDRGQSGLLGPEPTPPAQETPVSWAGHAGGIWLGAESPS